MNNKKNMIALDCGNSSYRLVLGKFDGEKISMEVIAQESNDMVKIKDHYYWDILKIYNFLISNLKKTTALVDKIDSIGICTWGVDFALFDEQGNMLNNPLSYRNEIGEVYLEKLTLKDKEDLFLKTGILCNRINSVYLLSAMKEIMPQIYNATDKLLMMPDIINYLLTGVMQNEPSELSTTQLFNSADKKVDIQVCQQLNISPDLFSEIGVHGNKIGDLLPSIKEQLGIDYDIPVVCVPSHDTASAVAAIPAAEDEFIFISSGTWSLIGAELDTPIINKEAMKSELTNEVGAFNKITLLKNSAGMFIIQRIKKEYDEFTGKNNSWESINNLSLNIEEVTLMDVNDVRFFNPKSMVKEILQYLSETGQYDKEVIDWGVIVKTVQESMACNYAVTIRNLEEVVGKVFDTVYLAGGGSQNVLINELTAKRTGKRIVTCGKESTCLGNLGVQLNYFDSGRTLKEIREILKNSIEINEYKSYDKDIGIVEQYSKLLS